MNSTITLVVFRERGTFRIRSPIETAFSTFHVWMKKQGRCCGSLYPTGGSVVVDVSWWEIWESKTFLNRGKPIYWDIYVWLGNGFVYHNINGFYKFPLELCGSEQMTESPSRLNPILAVARVFGRLGLFDLTLQYVVSVPIYSSGVNLFFGRSSALTRDWVKLLMAFSEANIAVEWNVTGDSRDMVPSESFLVFRGLQF